ncbi:MAG: NnrS family protein, partial [Pseudomonadales bacterium]
PAFSWNAVATLRPRSWVTIEWLAIGLTVLIVATDIVRAAGGRMLLLEEFQQVLLIVCATVHLIRLAGWQPWKTWRIPLLLVLPLAYLWIPVHLILRIDHPTLATHALTVGAMAGLMLAMMTRSALGHTGRALVARPVELLCFASIHLAALTRVVGPILLPEFYQAWIQTSALLWTLAFSVFALAYWPILSRPRIDQTST